MQPLPVPAERVKLPRVAPVRLDRAPEDDAMLAPGIDQEPALPRSRCGFASGRIPAATGAMVSGRAKSIEDLFLEVRSSQCLYRKKNVWGQAEV